VTTTTPTPADGLERRLAAARIHLDRLAAFVAGPDADSDVMAGAYETIGSVAQVAACQLRGEPALR